jgi:hypothetical protein
MRDFPLSTAESLLALCRLVHILFLEWRSDGRRETIFERLFSLASLSAVAAFGAMAGSVCMMQK